MDNYDDIISHERYSLQYHTPMTMHDRASQFSSFKALEGFEDEIVETARLTDHQREMTEDELAELDTQFQRLISSESEHPTVTIVYFQPNAKKNGGRYVRYTGKFRFYDEVNCVLKFEDGFALAADLITTIRISQCRSETEP